MIKLEKVNKYFNRFRKNQIHVINNTSLEFGDNGLVALLGPSGCGKTTLLNTIGGLDGVNKGKIYINGKKITRRSSYMVDKIRNLNIGYIFQDYLLVDNLSVFDNIALPLKMLGIKDKEEIKKRVYYVLEKVGMYRYKGRYASMLSGGERQRVGIARAIVKNPSIIIADEPTGNLDSKNTIEIMNIIKSISKEKLVLLVTHEKELAHFYSSRIIELKDGKVESDKENKHENELDYRIDNKIYLKDFENHKTIVSDDYKLNYYSDKNEKLDIDVVIKNGNIYIQSNSKEKIEVIDENTNIEFVNDHYKKIDKSEYENYDFHIEEFKNKKLKYASILNPITTITKGFRKVFDYTFLKKLLLAGFFASGMFILYSISNAFGVTNIKDEKFIKTNRDYLTIIARNISVDNYLKYENNEEVFYTLPGTSQVAFKIKYTDFYQTSAVEDSLAGSLTDIETINEESLIYGVMPQNEYEIVVDKLTMDKLYEQGYAKQAGYGKYEKFIGKEVFIDNMKTFKIVGISDEKNPSIYVSRSQFINIIANNSQNAWGWDTKMYSEVTVEEKNYEGQIQVLDYLLKSENISLEKGRWPTNDYEVIVNIRNKDSMPLNKYINDKVNDKQLLVVGYYYDKYGSDLKLVNNNTVKYNLIRSIDNITVYPKDKTRAIDSFRSMELNIEDTYEKDRKTYIDSMKESTNIALVISGVMLTISFIEIFLMIRSSFLSRIKEVGIYRAIGVKKSDIYKMFYGEIIAITTLAGLTGMLFMYYIISKLKSITYITDLYMLDTKVVLIAVILMFVFNVTVGLIPVHNTIKKKPSRILSRIDVD